MTETNLGNRNQKIHGTLSTHCPRTMEISKTQMLSEASSGALLSRSLPIIKKSSSEQVRPDRGGIDGKKISFRSTGKEWKPRHLITNMPFSNGIANYPNPTVNLSSSPTSSAGGGLEWQARSERTNGLSGSNLSLSTLSLSSSNEGDDEVTEQFWKLLADDRRTTTKSVDERGVENGNHNVNWNKSNGVKGYENGYSNREQGDIFWVEKEWSTTNGRKISGSFHKCTEIEKNGSASNEGQPDGGFREVEDSLGLKGASLSTNESSSDESSFEMVGSFLGNRHQSTPKQYNRHSTIASDFGSVAEFNHLNNEERANEFLKRVMVKRDCRYKAKVWVKWTTIVKRRAKERMRSVFYQWKEVHLQMKRESLSSESAQRKQMKQTYYDWKLSFDAERRTTIASFHFKLAMLAKCLQLWKVYISERRVKAKMNRLARLHFEHHATKKLFIKWKSSLGKSSIVTRAINKRLLVRVFNGWRKWTQYSKISHKRHLSSSKEYHNRTMMKRTFKEWRYQLHMRISLKYHIMSMQRRAYTLWQLKYQRIVLRRRISIVHGNMILQRKYFNEWRDYLAAQVKRRAMCFRRLNKIQLNKSFAKWKYLTAKSLSIKESQSLLIAARTNRAVRKAFCKWKQRLAVIRFQEKVATERTNRNIRNAAMKWRGQAIENQLQQKLVAASPFFEFLKLKTIFKHWLHEKYKIDREKQRSNVIASIISRGCLARVFTEWRIVTQEDGTIHHMVARIQRRELARSFDGWRLIIARKKVAVHYRRVRELEKAKVILNKWRRKHNDKVQHREIKKSLERNLMGRIINVWNEMARDAAHQRTLLATKYYNTWRKNCTARIDARERRDAVLANRRIVLKTRFRLWACLYDEFRKRRIENEAKAREYNEWMHKMTSLKRWKRQFHIHCIVSEYNEDKRIDCLDNAFSQWKEFVQHQLQDAVGRFTDRLERDSPRSLRNHALSDSYTSGDIALLRSSSGYFGSLPNIAKMSSPLSISPLATERSIAGQDSPFSISPVYPYDRSPRSVIFERSNTFSSPATEERVSSFERSRSLINERPKSPHSVQSSGNLPNRTKSPYIVPPLFTSEYKTDDEECIELTRPKSLPPFEPLQQADTFSQKGKSTDEDSPCSVYGQNFDEDAISCYSFRSGSIGMNREHFISGTIRHWRHLPLSKTFRAWYKYTQNKKLRAELFSHFTLNKNLWTIRNVFLKWHRKLYCRLASEKFARMRLLRRYMKGISNNVLREKAERERNIVAQLHLKNTQLSSTFKLWRGRILAKKKLHSLVGRWQEAVHISETHKMKCNQILKKKEYKMLKGAFFRWRNMSDKFSVAKEFFDNLLMKRKLRLWRKHVKKTKTLTTYFYQITLMRSHKVLSRWKQAFYSQKQAQEHFKHLGILRFKKTFYSWLESTREKKRRSSQLMKFQKRSNLKLVAKAFFIWSEEAARLRVADDHYKETIIIKIIESWHDYTEMKLDLAVRLQDYRTSSTRTKMRKVFDWWKRSAICSGVFKERQKLQTEAILASCFLEWKKCTQQSKSERYFKHMVLRRAFSKWSWKCFIVNKQRRLATNATRKWFLKTKANQSLEKRCTIYAKSKEMTVKETTFLEWRHAAKQSRVARAHFETNLIFKTINTWHEKAAQKRLLRKNKNFAENIVESNLVSSAFYKWVDLYRRRCKYEVVLKNYLELKQQEMLFLCLTNFRVNALKARSEKYRRDKMQRMVWDSWNDEMHRRNTLAKIRKRLTEMVAVKYARKWRERTKDLIGLTLFAEQQRMKQETARMRRQFQTWFLKTRARSLAKLCFEGHLLKSTFIQWKRSTKLTLSRKANFQKFKKKRELGQLREMFGKWNATKVKIQNEKKLEEVHEQIAKSHFRKSLIEKCFYGWRSEYVIGKFCRKRDLRICSEYFGVWKCQSLGGTKAEKLYHQKLIEHAWKRWRKYKIKKDVMAAMVFHDNRKQLSEVFSAWYNYVYIQRQAIKDFENIKMRTTFRKWMQAYNKS